jgi:CheY-like chemotaxis protein
MTFIQPEIKLIDILSKLRTDDIGYLKFRYTLSGRKQQELNIAVVNGNIIYSDTLEFSIENLFAIIQRYTIQTRIPEIDNLFKKILSISAQTLPQDKIDLLIRYNAVDEAQVLRAIRSKILSDLDRTLYVPGIAEFVPYKLISAHLPIKGFSIDKIILMSRSRINSWGSLNFISRSDVPKMIQPFIRKRYFPMGQDELIKQKIEEGLTIGAIAESIARDDLDIVLLFAEMVRDKLIVVPSKEPKAKATTKSIPPIIAIDASNLILTEICKLLDARGYPYQKCNDMDLAVSILNSQKNTPAMILVDLNMLGNGDSSILYTIRNNPVLSPAPVAIMSNTGRVSRLTAQSMKKYYEVQKPGGSIDSTATFRDEISGLLDRAYTNKE